MFNHYWEMRRERPALYCNGEQRETQEPSPNGAQSSRFLRRMERAEDLRFSPTKVTFGKPGPRCALLPSCTAHHNKERSRRRGHHYTPPKESCGKPAPHCPTLIPLYKSSLSSSLSLWLTFHKDKRRRRRDTQTTRSASRVAPEVGDLDPRRRWGRVSTTLPTGPAESTRLPKRLGLTNIRKQLEAGGGDAILCHRRSQCSLGDKRASTRKPSRPIKT